MRPVSEYSITRLEDYMNNFQGIKSLIGKVPFGKVCDIVSQYPCQSFGEYLNNDHKIDQPVKDAIITLSIRYAERINEKANDKTLTPDELVCLVNEASEFYIRTKQFCQTSRNLVYGDSQI